MEEPTKKYTKFKIDTPTYYQFQICDFHNGKEASGGPIIAYFGDEELADEYCEFKNKQRENEKRT